MQGIGEYVGWFMVAGVSVLMSGIILYRALGGRRSL